MKQRLLHFTGQRELSQQPGQGLIDLVVALVRQALEVFSAER